MFGGLKKLLGRVGAQVNPFDNGTTFNNPNPNQGGISLPGIPPSQLHNSLREKMAQIQQMQPMEFVPTMDQQGNPTGYPGAPDVPQGVDPATLGYPPDITVDPTGQTPYSARTPELAKLGNQYTANPTSPRFLNVDPAQFGYPADDSSNILRRLLGK